MCNTMRQLTSAKQWILEVVSMREKKKKKKKGGGGGNNCPQFRIVVIFSCFENCIHNLEW